MHLYEEFYSADIIIASPISLAVMLSKKSADFLSSIEVLVVDQADVLTMQNWQHVDTGEVAVDSVTCCVLLLFISLRVLEGLFDSIGTSSLGKWHSSRL